MIIKYTEFLLLLLIGLQLPAKCMSNSLDEAEEQKLYTRALKVICKNLAQAGFDLEQLAQYLGLSIQETQTSLGINESNLSNPMRISLTPLQLETAAQIRSNKLLPSIFKKNAEKLQNTKQIKPNKKRKKI